jgi:uncharacterized membrane protein
MKPHDSGEPRLETLLARQLYFGTWLASIIVAVGLGLTFFNGSAGEQVSKAQTGMQVVLAGIALFILLPVLRLVVMLIVFLRERNYRFGLITAVVLIIIALGVLLGSLEQGGPKVPSSSDRRRLYPGQD